MCAARPRSGSTRGEFPARSASRWMRSKRRSRSSRAIGRSSCTARPPRKRGRRRRRGCSTIEATLGPARSWGVSTPGSLPVMPSKPPRPRRTMRVSRHHLPWASESGWRGPVSSRLLRRLQPKPDVNQDRKFELAVPVSAVDHVLGASHGPVTIVEYGDFECPNCKQAAPGVKLLLERHPRRIRFAYRHLPLEEGHPHALLAAEAAECAGSQGKFWEMHDLLFDNQAHLKPKHLHDYAERLELDMARYVAGEGGHAHPPR